MAQVEPVDITIALAGNPNAGKTSLFNALTGAHQHVGNYPGVTVEKKFGHLRIDGRTIEINDLPGIYSLTAYSPEERVAMDYVLKERPQVIIDVVDAANLERNLYLGLQFMELGAPLVIALNMIDVAESRGLKIDPEELSKSLGAPVVPTVARTGKGVDKLLETAVAEALKHKPWRPKRISYGRDLDQALAEMIDLIGTDPWMEENYPPSWLALKLLEGDDQIRRSVEKWGGELGQRLLNRADQAEEHIEKTLDDTADGLIADYRYGYLTSAAKPAVSQIRDRRKLMTDRIDLAALNRFFGPLILLTILYSVYTFTFTLSEAPTGWLETLFGLLSQGIEAILPEGPLRSLIVSGVIDGVGGVLGFTPLIALMFLAIAFLEDSGYMARVAFIMDRLLRTFGLHGSSVLSLIVGGGIAGGCAVPAVMGARTLRDPKERLATILVTPMMNCGAKLPIYAVLIAAFFERYQAKMFFLLTLISWALALSAAWILRQTVVRGGATPFVMELPPYRLPTVKGLLIHTWERTWQYVKKAGTIILAISILMWALLTYPGLPAEREAEFAARLAAATSAQAKTVVETDWSQARTAASAAGRLGRALTAITEPLGFNWQINVALIGGFTAKEVIVSTLGTVYSTPASDEDSSSLAMKLKKSPDWSPLTAFCLILFVMVYAPCVVTLAVIRKEAGIKWALFSLGYNTVLAYILALVVRQAGLALGLGV